MSFDTYESSVEDGRPITLYRFTLGATVWRYAAADEDLDLDGHVWKRAAISDGGVSQTGEAVSDSFVIEADCSIGPVQLYVTAPPSDPITVERLNLHEGLGIPLVSYVGELIQVDPGVVVAKLSCQTLSASMRRNGVWLGWQRSCPYALYAERTCKVDKTLWDTSATISAVSGASVTASAFATKPDGYFAGGFFSWSDPIRGVQHLTVESHVGDTIETFGISGELFPGLVVTAYPGCARTLAACNGFGNILNYGGFPAMPGKSPFDGTPVF